MNKSITNRRLIGLLSLVALMMFGFGFALVPLYNLMCKKLGINGKTNTVSEASTVQIDNGRTVKIEFLTTTNAGLAWKFIPQTRAIEIHPGADTRVNFFAQNLSSQTMTVQAIPSVTPGLAAKYLKKTECFCFSQQTLAAGESMVMPVLFHIDDELPASIHEISLSYTLFRSSKKLAAKQKVGRIW